MTMIKGNPNLVIREFRVSKIVNGISRIGSIVYAYKLEPCYCDSCLAKVDELIEMALKNSGYNVEKDPYYDGGRSESEWMDYLSRPVERLYINADIGSQSPTGIGYASVIVNMYNMCTRVFTGDSIPVFDDFPKYETSVNVEDIKDTNVLIDYWNAKKLELYDVLSALYVKGNVLECPKIIQCFYEKFTCLQKNYKSLHNIPIVAYNEVTWNQLQKDNNKPKDCVFQAVETRKYKDKLGITTFAIIENSNKCALLNDDQIEDCIFCAFDEISAKIDKC